MPRGIWAGVIYWIFFFAMLILAIRHDIRQPEPAIINYHSEIGQAGTEKKGDGRQQQKSLTEGLTDDPVAFATLIVAFATGALAISTIGLWRVTRRSVDVAERALTDLERPFLLPCVHPIVFEVRRDQRHREFLRYGFCNYGRTPAIITHRHAECIITDSPLKIPDIAKSIVPNLVLAPGEKYEWEYADLMGVTFSDISTIIGPSDGNHVTLSPIIPGGTGMYFFVFIRYVDIFKTSHDTLRCWKYRRLAFRPHEGEDYNRTT